MPNQTTTNMTVGEVSEHFNGRSDVASYFNAARTLLNYVVTEEGGWRARPPTQHVAQQEDHTKESRMIPFISEVPDKVNVLLFEENKISIIKNRAITVVDGSTYSAYVGYRQSAKSEETVSTMTFSGSTVTIDFGLAHSFIVGDTIVVHGADQAGYNGAHKVDSIGTNTLTFITNQSPVSPATGTIHVYDTEHPYTEAQLQEIDYAQSADVLFLVQGDNIQKKLTRYTDKYWVLEDFQNLDGPFLDQNSDEDITMKPSVTTGSGTITCRNAADSGNVNYFASTDVGRVIRIRHKDTGTNPGVFIWGSALITGYTNAYTVSITVQDGFDFLKTTNNKNWRIGSWSATRGYPKKVTFHKGRLVYANTVTEPDTLWMSVIDAFNEFSPTRSAIGDPRSVTVTETDTGAKSVTKDVDGDLGDHVVTPDSAINFKLVANEVVNIKWITSKKDLIVGTQSGEFVVKGDSEGLTPFNVQADLESNEGCIELKPIQAANNVLFVSRAGTKIHEFNYAIANDSFEAPDISLLHKHMFKSGIKRITRQKDPFNIIWMCNNDGEFVGITYNPGEKVRAFHRHRLGGLGVSNDFPKVEDIVAVPSQDGDYDDVYITSYRDLTGSGSTNYQRHIEVLTRFVDPEGTESGYRDDLYFLDNSYNHTLSGNTFITSTELAYLNGAEDVGVQVDGQYRGTYAEVTSNTVYIPDGGTYANTYIGFHYDSIFKSLPIVPLSNGFTSNINRKKVMHVGIRFDRTNVASYGHDLNNLRDISFRTANDLMDEQPPLFSGQKRKKFTQGHKRDLEIVIKRPLPLPQHILAIEYELGTGNR